MTIHSLKFAWTKINLNLIVYPIIALSFVIIAVIILYGVYSTHPQIPTQIWVVKDDRRPDAKLGDNRHHFIDASNMHGIRHSEQSR